MAQTAIGEFNSTAEKSSRKVGLMDLERAVVSKIVYTGQIEKAISRNIAAEHFVDSQCQDMYKYIVSYMRRYKSAPSLEAAKHDKPEFEWLQIQDTLDYLIDRFSVLVKRRMADEYLEDIARACDDPERSENIDLEFLEASHRLITAVPTGHVERFSDVDKRIEEHEQRKKEGKPLGVPYGFPTLDQMTTGIRPHELITVLGFTNVGKSTLLRVLAFNFWMQGYTALYFSLEMDAFDILESMDAMAAGLDYAKLRGMDLSSEDMNKWRQFSEKAKTKKCDIPIIDSIYRITPELVYAETLRHKPDVVIVDYVGLMRSSQASRGVKRYQQLSEITQDLKINARMLKIPIIMAAQTNRAGAKDGAELENTADSITIAQDSDTVIGLFQDEEMEQQKLMEIRLNKSRKGPRGKFKVTWDHENQIFREPTLHERFGRPGGNGKAPSNVVGNWMNNRVEPFARV